VVVAIVVATVATVAASLAKVGGMFEPDLVTAPPLQKNVGPFVIRYSADLPPQQFIVLALLGIRLRGVCAVAFETIAVPVPVRGSGK